MYDLKKLLTTNYVDKIYGGYCTEDGRVEIQRKFYKGNCIRINRNYWNQQQKSDLKKTESTIIFGNKRLSRKRSQVEDEKG